MARVAAGPPQGGRHGQERHGSERHGSERPGSERPGAATGSAGKDFAPDLPIVLIGPMAVGKSAIGHHLAGVLGLEFVDTDQLIVAKHGPFADIFASRGEGFFRLAEARTVADVLEQTARKPFVLSLGGGAVLDSGTQQLLARTTVVHLDADLPTVRERINRNSGRPLLHGDPLERWRALAEVRTPVYRRLADVTLDVRHGSVDALVQRLIDILSATATKTEAPAATATTTAANRQALQNGTT